MEERCITFIFEGNSYSGTFKYPAEFGEYTITVDYCEKLYDIITGRIRSLTAVNLNKFDCTIGDEADRNGNIIEKELKGCIFTTMYPIALGPQWDGKISFDLVYDVFKKEVV